jgi:hypothetical protein
LETGKGKGLPLINTDDTDQEIAGIADIGKGKKTFSRRLAQRGRAATKKETSTTETRRTQEQSQQSKSNLNTEDTEKLRRARRAEDLPNKILRGMARI